MGERVIKDKFNIHETYRKMNITNSYRYNNTGGGSAYLFDEIGAAPLLAYSFRLLNPNYSGACLRARRESDGSEKDVFFVNNYVDTDDLLSFSQGGTVFIVKLYNQAAGGVDLYRGTGYQPYLVYNGVLETVNGYLSFRWREGIQLLHTESAVSLPANSTELNVIKNETSTYYSIGRTNSGYYGIAQPSSGSGSINSSSGTPTAFINGVELNPKTRGEIYSKTTGNIALYSVKNLTLPSNISLYTAYNNSSLPSLDYWFEKIHYPTLSDADRQTVENNSKTYYGI
jgi:hypothetical protein